MASVSAVTDRVPIADGWVIAAWALSLSAVAAIVVAGVWLMVRFRMSGPRQSGKGIVALGLSGACLFLISQLMPLAPAVAVLALTGLIVVMVLVAARRWNRRSIRRWSRLRSG